MTLPRILISSRISPTAVGGLANYQRHLGEELETRSIAGVSFFCEETKSVPKTWNSLAARPWLHRLLEIAIKWHYRPALQILKGTPYTAVHFVGTGWDFKGFAMHAFARSIGARFTIWPAVHPGQWGDDHLDLRLYHKADAVMCQSDSEAHFLTERGLEAGKIVRCGLPPLCLANGDGPRFRSHRSLESRPAVLFLGRRDEGKGYPALLRAWPEVLRECPNAVLLLGGPGGMEYGDLLQALPAESVRDLDIPSKQDLADALAACDVFCLPSAHESFGIVYVEAWSYAKPVLCGAAIASRELVEDGVTGLWTNQDPKVLAASIVRLLNNRADSERMGLAGQRLQRAQFTWEKILAIHQEAFGLPVLTGA